MPKYNNYPMVLNNVFLGMLGLRDDQQRYFNIPDATAAELSLQKITIEAESYQRNLHSNRLDSTAPTRQVTVKRKARSKDRTKDHLMRGGRPIIIPTELISTPVARPTADPSSAIVPSPSYRTTIIKFPRTADISEISAWVYGKFAGHKPKFIKVPGGRVYTVAPFGVGQVTGAGDGTTP